MPHSDGRMAQDQNIKLSTVTSQLAKNERADGAAVSPPAEGQVAPSHTKAMLPPPLPKVAQATPSTADNEAAKEAGSAAGQDAGPAGGAAKKQPPPAGEQRGVEQPQRRVARRRPAGPVRGRVAANDDAPSIGGLIYALEQKPSNKPFTYAGIASAVWGGLGAVFVGMMLHTELSQGTSLGAILMQPMTFLVTAAMVVPIAVLWFLALLSWRAEELRLRSSTMTEVAVRLAEPDRMAEQSIASLGQAVRRQVSFMNDAVSRALGRAGELEALVHNEVAALERSYEENELKIRGLIKELSGEREALVGTSDRVTETLRTLGSEVPTLIDKLSNQQVKLAQIIQGAGENLTSLETALASSAGRLESSLGARTEQLQSVLEGYSTGLGNALESRTQQMQTMLQDYTGALGTALGSRTEQMQAMLENYTGGLASALGDRTEQMQAAFEEYMRALDTSIGNRTENLQTVFEEYARALDSTLANRAQALDIQLVERTKSLDEAFSERLRLFDESVMRSTLAIDSAVGERAQALTHALDAHAKTFSETIGRQASDLDESLMHGINAVRRSSESITRQSIKAIEGLASQSDLLKNVSENLLGQIHGVTSRFENQGQAIMKAANALETANYKIDATLQSRHTDLSRTLDRLSGKADEFGRFLEGYSTSIEGTLTEAELRARAVAEELKSGTESRQRDTIAELERMKAVADAESERALDDLRRRFATVSTEVTQQLGSLTSRFDETSEVVRERAARAAAEISEEQARLRAEFERLPSTTRESADAMRRALQDQLKALDQLSQLTSRVAQQRDVSPPLHGGALTTTHGSEQRPGASPEPSRSLSSLSSTLAQEISARQQRGLPAALPPEPQAAPAARSFPPAAPSFPAAPAAPAQEARESWSLGDLLARASLDEEGHSHAPQAPAPVAQPFALNVDAIARALDPATASAIWARLRGGQRGIMVRSIYSAEGRAVFDEITRRYKTDASLQGTVNRYLADFELILKDAEQKDPSGRLAQSHFVSETGRVYLFLAHASGRLV